MWAKPTNFRWHIGLCEQVSDLAESSIVRAPQRRSSILVSAGKVATTWSERGIALGGAHYQVFILAFVQTSSLVIIFVTLLHGLTPRSGVYFMNVRIYPFFGLCIPSNQFPAVDDFQNCHSCLHCDNRLGCTLRKDPHRQSKS